MQSKPSTISIRTAAEENLAAVAQIHVASFQDAYTGILPDAFLNSMTVEGMHGMWQSNHAKFPENIEVAVNETGECLGFSCAGPVVDQERSGPFEFEVYGLHVRPGLRRNGIGRSLLNSAFRRAAEKLEMRTAIIWTLEELDLSCKFYEREGGRLLKRNGKWGPDHLAIPEVAYGWDELVSRFSVDE